jgi:hypothetical protein
MPPIENSDIDYIINISWELVKAARKGDSKKVEKLLNKRFIEPTAWYNNALAFAAQHGHINCVKILLADERIRKSDLGHTIGCVRTTSEIRDMIKKVWVEEKQL